MTFLQSIQDIVDAEIRRRGLSDVDQLISQLELEASQKSKERGTHDRKIKVPG